jgi:hypothetical protein
MPPMPQAVWVRPERHVAPAQHPVGHVAALQVDWPHCPPLQAVIPQSRQARPPVPQAPEDVVVTHWLPMQHPAHDVGVH